MGPSGPCGPGRRAYRGFMDTAPGPAEWLAWWSWPWRAAGAGTSSFPSFAPQALNQPILPGWLFANSINVTEENSSSPETEQEIVAAHSYGQQLGRIMDVVDELIRNEPAGSLGAGPLPAGLRALPQPGRALGDLPAAPLAVPVMLPVITGITYGGRTRQIAWAEETVQVKDYGRPGRSPCSSTAGRPADPHLRL